MADKADWSGALGAEWAKSAEIMEKMLDPFGRDAMRGLGPVRGKTILDLGCGAGGTTFSLAQRVGAYGAVVGVDVSPDLIRLAAARRADQAKTPSRVGFLCSDAATARFGKPFGGLFSQFGAMFFDQPVAAWANLRRAMLPGAPLSVVCWRAPKENDWAMLAYNAARKFLPPAEAMARGAPGPFAWADPEATFAPTLAKSGWKRVKWKKLNRSLVLGDGAEGQTGVDRALAFSMKIGPLASRLRGVDAKTRAEVRKAVRAALELHARNDAVEVGGACWLVSARA